MRIQTILFQRQKSDVAEEGILINEGFGPILDNQGKVVSKVWDYVRTETMIINVDLGEDDARQATNVQRPQSR